MNKIDTDKMLHNSKKKQMAGLMIKKYHRQQLVTSILVGIREYRQHICGTQSSPNTEHWCDSRTAQHSNCE